MRLITTQNGTKIKIFSSAKELTIDRYTELQKQIIISATIGDDAQSAISSVEKLKDFIEDGKYEDSVIQCKNLLQSLKFATYRQSCTSAAFAVLVAEIDGVAATDITTDGLLFTIEKLKESGITQGELEESVEELKKK